MKIMAVFLLFAAAGALLGALILGLGYLFAVVTTQYGMIAAVPLAGAVIGLMVAAAIRLGMIP